MEYTDSSPVPPEFAAALTANPEDAALKYALSDYWRERGREDWAGGWYWLGEQGKWPDRGGRVYFWDSAEWIDDVGRLHDVHGQQYPHSSRLPATVIKLMVDLDTDYKCHRLGNEQWFRCGSVVEAFGVAVLRVSQWLVAAGAETIPFEQGAERGS